MSANRLFHEQARNDTGNRHRLAAGLFAGLLPGLLTFSACSYTVPSSDGAAASVLSSLAVVEVVAAAAAAPAVTLDSMDSAFVSGGGGRASTNWSFTTTVDGKYTVRKDASGCADGSVMVGPNDVTANVANAGPTINATDLNIGANNFALCVYYNDADEIEQTVSATFTVTRDDTAPTTPTTMPADSASNVPPSLGKITLTFADTMDTASTPTITADVGGNALPTTGTVFNWKDSSTLEINLSWVYFPENISINWTVTAAGLQDAAGNPLATSISQSFSTTAGNASFAQADSGQTNCYGTGNGSAQSCPNASVPGQDGELITPAARSFTSPIAHSTYTNDYTTKDNVTGLIWRTCVVGRDGATCSGGGTTFTWYDAINACASMNSMNSGAGYAGITNWRLPSIAERMTITDYARWYPSLDSAVFPGSPVSASRAWTSTGYAGSATDAHRFYIGTGASEQAARTIAAYTRCVSGGGAARSFTDNGDGTVTDNNTGLIWARCLYGRTYSGGCSGGATNSNWQTALANCRSLGGTWRLPSVSELVSTLDFSRKTPAFDSTYFDTNGNRFWTSTTYNGQHNQAHAVQTSLGLIQRNAKSGTRAYRCVSGP